MDNSDEISYFAVLRQILTDLAPTGDWLTHPLYLKWLENRYSLSVGEFNRLTLDLDSYRVREEYNHIKRELGKHCNTAVTT